MMSGIKTITFYYMDRAMAVLNPAGSGTFPTMLVRTSPGLLNTFGTVIDREGALALWKGLNPVSIIIAIKAVLL